MKWKKNVVNKLFLLFKFIHQSLQHTKQSENQKTYNLPTSSGEYITLIINISFCFFEVKLGRKMEAQYSAVIFTINYSSEKIETITMKTTKLLYVLISFAIAFKQILQSLKFKPNNKWPDSKTEKQ